jgi:hypothetical protein
MTATTQLLQKILGGVFCSSSTSGTLTIYDSASSGTSTTIVGVFNLTANTFYPLPFSAVDGLYFVIGGTAAITAGVK